MSEAPIEKALVAIIPCYNAGPRIEKVVEDIAPVGCRTIIVDDGSTDGVIEPIADCVARVVRLEPNRGKGHAIIAGLKAALAMDGCECVITLDADGQHDPKEIPNLFRAYREHDADLVIGSRTFDGSHVPWRSWFGNVVTVNVVGALLGRRLPDTQSGFRVHSRAFAEAVIEDVAGGRYETEMEIIVKAVKDGYTIWPEPIQTVYEPGNVSSHFRKFADSWLIYRRLFSAIRRHGKRN